MKSNCVYCGGQFDLREVPTPDPYPHKNTMCASCREYAGVIDEELEDDE